MKEARRLQSIDTVALLGIARERIQSIMRSTGERYPGQSSGIEEGEQRLRVVEEVFSANFDTD